jgi:hypothetical protein
MKFIKIILLNIALINICYSQEVKYTKSGIPIKFYGLLDVDNVNYNTYGIDTNSIIYKIKQQENGAYIRTSR